MWPVVAFLLLGVGCGDDDGGAPDARSGRDAAPMDDASIALDARAPPPDTAPPVDSRPPPLDVGVRDGADDDLGAMEEDTGPASPSVAPPLEMPGSASCSFGDCAHDG
ncbi:MAG: hypothetical protein IT379_27410, partial [Deltaproteobacteria bacterium]|nr:hypothetical protein [Deltaproteobacteria bacterium]